ncbi:MAG: ATP-binding protein [Jaaginema sp. PMC 1080.18]|nr:ATP-binding protein [Jaaginema sp. PMC 1080.18]MEC4866962.1 ATP-binding protein [Jaaginema sp. PMC 1078.18]
MFALVLSSFAGAVRLVFWRSLQQQLTARLTTLGEGAAAMVEVEGTRFDVEDDLNVADLRRQQQALQWFDLLGNLVEQQGEMVLSAPLAPDATVQVQDSKPAIYAITLPIVNSDTGQQVGYLRVSQSLELLSDTLTRLDWGLGIGVLVGLGVSGVGILWMTRQAMEPIESSFQRLKQFTADASHELRSPLMAISSNVEVALKYPEGMREEDHEAFDAIKSATCQMTQLTEDLLMLARRDRQHTPVQASVNLSALLTHLVALYQPQAQTLEIALTAAIEPDLYLWGDSDQLTRALTNLIQNALQYTPAGGQVSLSAQADNHQIHIMVQDTGIGIAPDHLTQVFERFWRADVARSHDQGGSGLGLAITQAIVQQHGGTITVSSQLQQGSSFEVQFSLSP